MKFMDVKDLFPAGRGGKNPAKGKAAPARGKMPGHTGAGDLTGMTAEAGLLKRGGERSAHWQGCRNSILSAEDGLGPLCCALKGAQG